MIIKPDPSVKTQVEVIWQILANHGGGYQYRLCPADEPGGLTEECFFRTPLDFNPAKQAIQWTNGTRLPIRGTFVRNGTLPAGSTWAMNPVRAPTPLTSSDGL